LNPQDELHHLQNELYRIKAKTRGKLHADLCLLRAALGALRKGKPHVTEDHLERVISSQEKFLEMLE
jgi:hypothetical protein